MEHWDLRFYHHIDFTSCDFQCRPSNYYNRRKTSENSSFTCQVKTTGYNFTVGKFYLILKHYKYFLNGM